MPRMSGGAGPSARRALLSPGLLAMAFTLPGAAGLQAQAMVGPLSGPSEAEEGESVAFSVLVDDPDGADATFEWNFGDGESLSTEMPAVSHEYLGEEGEHEVSVTVRTGSGGSQTRTFTITITNAAPAILQLESLTEPVRPEAPARFRAEAIDPGDDELTYTWDFGDGTAAQSGVDLREVRHVYSGAGAFTVTLTVIDEDGLEARHEMSVVANPGFLGRMGGEIPAFRFEGESGKAGMFNALGLFPGISSGVGLGGGVADLSDAMDVCMINAGFWDDENQAHVNFQLTVAPERLYDPSTYLLGWEHPDDRIAPGQLLITGMVLGIDGTYEDAKEGARSGQVFEGGLSGVVDALRGALGGLLGGAPSLGGGRNWQLTASAGRVTLTKVTPDVISGELRASMGGAWLEARESGEVSDVEVEGDFAWQLDDVAKANLRRCGDRPFQIESHSPEPEEKGVDFVAPRLRINFSEPVDPGTVRPETIEVGYLSSGGAFEATAGRFYTSDDRRTVFFEPEEPLKTGIYHHVRVRAGSSGVLSASSESLLDDYRFRFATVLRVVPLARGSGN